MKYSLEYSLKEMRVAVPKRGQEWVPCGEPRGSAKQLFQWSPELFGLPDIACLDMGDFAGGLLKYLRQHPLPRLTIAGGFAKLSKLAQGALDLHSGRSQVDMEWLAEKAGPDLNQNLREKILSANTALEVLELTREEGIDLPAIIARDARQTALDTLRGAPVAVDILVTDRNGTILAQYGTDHD